MRSSVKGFFLMITMLAHSAHAAGAAHTLTVGEGFVEPLGFHDETPTFSWKLADGVKRQSAYRIQVKDGWDSGWVESEQSYLVPYGGASFQSRQKVLWRVRYKDEGGKDSGWSSWASFELGLLSADDWTAQWIRVPGGPVPHIKVLKAIYRSKDEPHVQKVVTRQVRAHVSKHASVVASNKALGGDPAYGSVKELVLVYREDGQEKKLVLAEGEQWPKSSGGLTEPVAVLQRKFDVEQSVEKARLYVTARGLFEVSLNGGKVGRDHFANGWTSYPNRMDTLTYDVTDQLKPGSNTVSVLLGMGWYAGHMGFKNGGTSFYGNDAELLFQLELTYADGAVETVVSDNSWQGTLDGPVLSSSIYHGEAFDARKKIEAWGGVVANPERGSARLVPKPFAPVRVTETLRVQAISEPEPGRFIFDLGQNMVGWARVNMPVEKDQTVTLRFAEMLNPDGTMYTANYRAARSTDYYTAAETGTIEWEPIFTFHGFRYVELSGLPEGVRPRKDWVTGVVLHSDLQKIGSFESSHAKLNQLQSNITWGQRGNFLDIPTDCPQRNERLGWTGDAQVFAPTSMFNYDCHAFWKSWLGSMRDEQLPDGRIPHVIPSILPNPSSAGWMDAASIIPWDVYVRTGDVELLAENYEMMERLVGWYRAQSKDNLSPKAKGYGDWLQPYSEKTRGDTPQPLIEAAFRARSCRILSDSARVLGRTADAEKYAAEADAVGQAFTAHYFGAKGKLRNAPETQTAYLLALAFNLVPEDVKEKVVGHLVRLIDEADGHLRTGFLGTPYIIVLLDEAGHSDLALSILFKETYPSWFFSINQGATTMWERWNSYSHKEGFGPVGMNSFNHYAYGAVGQWMYERLAGLAPDPARPGYKHFLVRPLIAPQLDHARAELETPYGRASSGWAREGGGIVLEVVVPPNTTATIEFPDGRKPETVEAGTHQFIMENSI